MARVRAVYTPLGKKIRKVGEALAGEHWQAEVARHIDYSKSMITRILSGSRPIQVKFLENFHDEGIHRLRLIGRALGSDIFPSHRHPNTKKALALIEEATTLLETIRNPFKKRIWVPKSERSARIKKRSLPSRPKRHSANIQKTKKIRKSTRK